MNHNNFYAHQNTIKLDQKTLRTIDTSKRKFSTDQLSRKETK